MKRTRTDGLVIHRAEVWQNEYHFVILRNGKTLQLLDQDAVGAHALAFNRSTAAIAVEGDFAPGEHAVHNKPTPEQWTTLVELCVQLRQQYGPVWIKGHTELGPTATTFPEKLTPEHACPGTNLDLDALRAQVMQLEASRTC